MQNYQNQSLRSTSKIDFTQISSGAAIIIRFEPGPVVYPAGRNDVEEAALRQFLKPLTERP